VTALCQAKDVEVISDGIVAPFGKAFNEAAVQKLEAAFLDLPQSDCPITHRFAPGIYIREVKMPAGSYVIGHHHKTPHLNIMLSGRLTIINDDGSKTEMSAPQTFIANTGRKIAYIHEDVIWQNVFATEERDVSKLEDMFLEKSDAWLEAQKFNQMLLSFDHSEDVADFYATIEQFGFDPEMVRSISEDESDQIPFPHGEYKVAVGDSKIEGRGLFATGGIPQFEVIAPALIDAKRTPAGRFTNHSKNPNAFMFRMEDGTIYLVALRDIAGCKGGNLGEEITVDYRQALAVTIGGN
jgi:hypothetical protein